jgi:polyisoprenyl-phosphate glycosyltransferase
MQVAAIVPALNEEERIGQVLAVLKATAGLHEIIVVDDGSTDNTFAQVPSNNGMRAIRLEENRGKGAALLAGVEACQSDVLIFLDADLVNLRPEHVEALVAPVVKGEADMSTAIFRGGRWRTDWAQRLVPSITGQRALRKDFFLSIPGVEQSRFGLETAITQEAIMRGLRICTVPWEGVTHVLKEEKLGFVRGTCERAKMYWQMGAYRLVVMRRRIKAKIKAEG